MFPEIYPGDTVYVNSAIVGGSDHNWRPALVTKICNGETVDVSVFIQEQTMLKLEPRTNVRWHQDPKLNDPVFVAGFANDEDAGVFRLCDRQVIENQRMEAIMAALESIATDPKGSAKSVEAILSQLGGKPEQQLERNEPAITDDWRMRKLPTDKKQTAEERAAAIAAAE